MEEYPTPTRLECPGCGSSSFTPGPGGSFVCNYCHTTYSARRSQAYGQELDVMGELFTRATRDTAAWLQQQRDEAPAIKAQEEAASQVRLAEMWAVERRRREELALAQAEHDRQQKIIVAVAVAIVSALVIAALVIVAITVSHTPNPHFYPLP